MAEARGSAAEDLRGRHEALRDLLERNGALLELLAEIQLDLRLLDSADPVVRARSLQLLEATLLQAETLNILSNERHRRLYKVHETIEAEIRSVLARGQVRLHSDPVVLALPACGTADPALVGGKAARLGVLSDRLADRVPDGFVVTTAAHGRLLAHRQTSARLREVMKGLDLATDGTRLAALAAEARGLVLQAPVPVEIEEAIREQAGARGGVSSWAVRSSAVGEDGPFSFAGQFETLLHVPAEELPSAWLCVVASTFSDHVIRYRLACGLFELATPMAVLFMPMVAARAAGVLYTRDPARPDEDTVVVSAVRGLAPDLVGGLADAETSFVSRHTLAVEERVAPGAGSDGPSALLSDDELATLARLGLESEAVFGEALDVEWAVEESGRPRLLQARPLAPVQATAATAGRPTASCLARGGLTIVGGRAVGPAAVAETPAQAARVPEGAILAVPQAVPELGHLLPRIDGLVAEHGSLTGHLASLAREFGVPSVFGMPDATGRLAGERSVSLNATHCEIYRGEAWPPEERETRRRARDLRAADRSPLHRLILHLDLTDPRSPSFRPKGCHSLHDIVRFCHERGVAALFEDGDRRTDAARAGARRLQGGPLPDAVWVLDVGGGLVSAESGAPDVAPEQILSRPFRALWRGVTAPGIAWSGRRQVDLGGFASVVSSSLAEPQEGRENLGAAAYLIVGADYLNFNARMAYHFAMIDSVVGETPESNDVSFRFWGGGAGRAQRDLRAQFLSEALERSGFAVERRGELVTARLRRYPAPASEDGLEVLGRIMGCARQLDMLIRSDGEVADFVEHFLNRRHEEFA